MDLLKRELAPILPDAWTLIDAEAARVLRLHLAARKIVDFRGPDGWELAAVNTGRLDLLESGDPELHVGIRRVQPLVEVRVPVRLDVMELDTVARGGENPDLGALVKAAERIARAEDRAIFAGFAAAGITGIIPASPHAPQAIDGGVGGLPRAVVAAKETLRRSGIDGPYALAVSVPLYDQVYTATEDGYPVAKLVERQVDKVVRASALDGAVLVSMRGNDYELTVGQDLSIGFAYRDKHTVELYLTESFTFRVLEPAAAVRLS